MQFRMIFLEYFFVTGKVLGEPVPTFQVKKHLELPGKISKNFF